MVHPLALQSKRFFRPSGGALEWVILVELRLFKRRDVRSALLWLIATKVVKIASVYTACAVTSWYDGISTDESYTKERTTAT